MFLIGRVHGAVRCKFSGIKHGRFGTICVKRSKFGLVKISVTWYVLSPRALWCSYIADNLTLFKVRLVATPFKAVPCN